MTGREHFQAIMRRESGRCGFWHGDPNPDSIKRLYQYFGVADDFELGIKLGSICRWIMPEKFDFWQHPENQLFFDVLGGGERHSLGQPGVFAECEDVREVENFAWPNIEYVNFEKTLEEIDRTVEAEQAVLSGTWSCFFHNVCDFFGMENYFIKMHTDPEVVEAVTEKVVDFYLAANEILFAKAGDKIDAFFFGNDFGSQLDLLISPESFDRFILPAFIKFTQQAHNHGYHVLLHSCGSIARVIPRLIEAGVEALHPVQALAANMDAVSLSTKYNGKIVFVGGVDTQHLLPFGTPDDIKTEVRRLKRLFGPNYIVSPSHESILPNVPPENIVAMVEATFE